MGLQSSGQISLSNIATEFGGSAPHSLSEYYGKGNAPGSGEIQLAADFYGTSNSLPPATYTYNGVSPTPTNVTPASQTNSSLSLDGTKVTRLDIVAYGGAGAGSRWPFGAAGAYGGHAYRITITNRSVLDSISSLYIQAGNGGKGYSYGGTYWLPDNRQAGGAGGFSRVRINGSSGTTLITAAGGHGSRAVYQASPSSSSGYGTNAGFVGGSGGTGAAEGGNNSGGSATYGGGGGGSHPSGSGGSSTYSGNGGNGSTNGGNAPSGGDGGWDTSAYNRGAAGRVVIYVNNGGAIPF